MTSTLRTRQQPTIQFPMAPPKKLRLNHFKTMMTEIGMWQHSAGPAPDRRHGYSIDDQVRALIVAIDYYNRGVQREYMEWVGAITFDFVRRAAITEGKNAGRYHNFCDENGRWLDNIGSDDSLGRTIWALGVACAADTPFAPRDEAKRLLTASLEVVKELSPVRTIAFSILGAAACGCDREITGALADRLVHAYRTTASNGWHWFEEHLTYCNARLSMALFVAGSLFPERAEYLEIAETSLAFLLKTTRNDKGSYSPVGNEPLTARGWHTRGDTEPPLFDQQPVDAGALVECCATAYAVTGDPAYRHAAYEAYGWYFGRNVHAIPVYCAGSGGVADAITPEGVSLNMGAESVISIHLALQALQRIE